MGGTPRGFNLLPLKLVPRDHSKPEEFVHPSDTLLAEHRDSHASHIEENCTTDALIGRNFPQARHPRHLASSSHACWGPVRLAADSKSHRLGFFSGFR